MAKIRVYELARELNMQNQALLEKLSAMHISVKSHMSSLDDETVLRVKKDLFSPKTETVETTRVKPTVIRRRKKSVSEKSVQVTATAEPADVDQVSLTEKVEAADQPSEKALKATKPSVVKKTKLKDTDRQVAEKRETPEIKPKEDVSKKIDGPVKANSKAALAKDQKKSKLLVISKPKRPSALRPSKTKTVKPKKESPAKIIKLAVPSPEPEKASEPDKVALKSIVAPKEKEPPVEYKKKKKGAPQPEEDFSDKKFFKKKISFRRKEVVEGEDLYPARNRARKAHRLAKGKTAVTGQKTQITIAKAIKRRIKIDDTIVLADLAKRLGIKAGEIIKKLMDLGVMVTVNQTIDFDTAVLVAAEFDYELEKASFEEETVLKVVKDVPGKLTARPPVVTIMGHVDHGKTSLLDVIRKTKVTETEAGSITQHIGAYHVSTDKGQIVFLDTPGHEAFTAMRSRGAKITDIVVLVVAADDGVMPQTIEAINHSKAAGVPIIVALSKIDKPDADPERVQREIAELGLVPEAWGGDTIYVQVSAKENQGIDSLLEMILLQAEVLELKANPEKFAMGYVVEARLDSGRGAAATILVKEGTLHTGDAVVCGIHYGKVRALVDDRGAPVKSAGPSIPVEVIGLSGVPSAGDHLLALADEKGAKQVSAHRILKQRSKDLAKTSRLNLEGLFKKMAEGKLKDLNLIIKADVHGSVEALTDSLTKLSNEEVKINVIHSATGTITESDISLSVVSDAIIIGFNVRPNAKVQALANEENVDIRYYNIIYNVIKDIKNAIVGMMSSTFEEQSLGRAEVRELFHLPKNGTIAGCYVTDGKIQRGQLVRLLRDGIVCYEGKVGSLRRFKDDAKEVQSGYECGIGIENYNDIKLGDTIECYYMEEIKPEIIKEDA
ncbi:MAG: translation initiation factor IF-2 [Deltaproteobacteria bacterium CG1_02_45_11]|nr:MAG: translation initiation factor IF-2 [Deltaproteobacteria bacterium CG1_02_45_11]